MDNSCIRLLGTLMSPSSTSTMSAAFCFSTPDGFDPPLNPPTLSIRYALIPSMPVVSLPTSPCEPCHSSLSLIPASSPFRCQWHWIFILTFEYSSCNAQLRSQRDFCKMQREYLAATLVSDRLQLVHYISTSIALPCTQSPHLVNVSVITVAKWRKLEAQRDRRGKCQRNV